MNIEGDVAGLVIVTSEPKGEFVTTIPPGWECRGDGFIYFDITDAIANISQQTLDNIEDYVTKTCPAKTFAMLGLCKSSFVQSYHISSDILAFLTRMNAQLQISVYPAES